MKKGLFEHVIVIGYGIVTEKVLYCVWEKCLEYGYTMEYIEYEVYPFNKAKKFAVEKGIYYSMIENKKELLDYFQKKARTSLLIISASNNYLFPRDLVRNKNVTIINFHNALLPDLPGRNAPSWAIYEGKKKTGITWHYVSAEIDAGDIIVQKECEIDPDIKAYKLVEKLMKLASEAFMECYCDVLDGKAQSIVQNIPSNRKIYKSDEVPSDGYFSMDDAPDDIYRLLRAVDYGKNNIFPLIKTEYNGEIIQIHRYKKIKAEEQEGGEYRIYFKLSDGNSLMLHYKPISYQNN